MSAFLIDLRKYLVILSLVGVIPLQLFDDGSDQPTGAAPRGPAVNDRQWTPL